MRSMASITAPGTSLASSASMTAPAVPSPRRLKKLTVITLLSTGIASIFFGAAPVLAAAITPESV